MIEAARTRRSARGWTIIALRWIAALAVIGVLLHFLPLATVRSAIARVPPQHFAAALAGYLLAHTLGVLKWRMVVNAAGAELDLATSLQCYGGGLFGTLFLPSIVGGDVIRLAVGLRRSPRPAAVLAGNVVDRFLDVAAQGSLVALGLALLPGSLPESLRSIATRTLLFGFLIGCVLVRSRIFSARRAARWSLDPISPPPRAPAPRATQRVATPARPRRRLARRNRDSIDIPRTHRVARHRVRTEPAAPRLAFRVAAGKTRRAAPANSGRHRRPRSRARRVARPVRRRRTL